VETVENPVTEPQTLRASPLKQRACTDFKPLEPVWDHSNGGRLEKTFGKSENFCGPLNRLFLPHRLHEGAVLVKR
jgi:hypothetical protein